MTNLPAKSNNPIELATLSKHMVSEVIRFIEKKREDKGDDKFASDLSIQFLASYVGALVYSVLKEPPPDLKADKDKMLEHYTRSFLEIKMRIQDAVSAGVAGALTTATGKSIEYYTQIKVVPEPVNKQPC